MSEEGPGGSERVAVVLDYLPHGRPEDDRPQYQKSALAHAVDVSDFDLYELELAEDADVSIGDRVSIDPPDEGIDRVRSLDYDELSGGATSELEHAVTETIQAHEDRYVEFFNEAGAVTVRLHQFNLLPGIGDKIRDDILDERRREPFDSLDDLEDRISGLHDPLDVLTERVLDEIRDEDVKYKLFARSEE